MWGVFFFILGFFAGFPLFSFAYAWARKESEVQCCGGVFGLNDLNPLPLFREAASASSRACPACGARVNPLFPILAALGSGALFFLVYQEAQGSGEILKLLVLVSLLILVTLIDFYSHIIPNPLVLALLAWGVLWQVIQPSISWPDAFFGLLFGGGFLLLAAIISRGGMGGGDIKLMLAAGFFLGFAPTVMALFIAVFSGAVVGILLLLFRIKKRKDPIPFGPFLCLGIVAALLNNPQLLTLYLGQGDRFLVPLSGIMAAARFLW